jgi:hypothetical protein
VLFVLASLAMFWGLFHLFGAITDQFKSLGRMLPLAIMGTLPFFGCYAVYKEYFVKRMSSKGFFVFLFLYFAFWLTGFILFTVNLKFYLYGLAHKADPVIFFVEMAVELAFVYYLGVHWGKARLKTNVFDCRPLFADLNLYGYKKARKAFIGIYAFIACYFLGDFFVALFRFNNFAEEPAAYFIFLLFLLLPALDLVYVLFGEKKLGWTVFLFVCTGLTLVGIVGFVGVWFGSFMSVVKVGQNLFFLTFATSFPFGPLGNLICLSAVCVFNFKDFPQGFSLINERF